MKEQIKEFFSLAFKFNLKGLFISPTKNSVIQLFRSVFVGGIATVIDFIVYALVRIPIASFAYCDLIATPVGFVVGTVVNFVISKILVFKMDEAKMGVKGEFVGFAVIGIIGLGIKELLMLLFVNVLLINNYVAWIVSALLVLIWNFAGRKIAIYK